MLCTNSIELLNSVNGRISLNYFAPKGPPKAYLGPDHLAVAWDILMQDYRNINMNQCNLIQQIPANEDFWVYFNENIYFIRNCFKNFKQKLFFNFQLLIFYII